MSAEVLTARPYNGIASQRAAILATLRQSPATGAQLIRQCHAPDPTARIHELRTEGHQIETQWTDQRNPDGSVNRVALYVLHGKDDRQRELDLNA
ncbi:helix-turn-helix domain-containing protein [Hydrogenophaga atypica]|uniref:Helix-turn-helix domain-containing protein n=1 Tax=Hydrogenophaga atypica TaxID=249409 RepID=A0ABW2QL64_9BURK